MTIVHDIVVIDHEQAMDLHSKQGLTTCEMMLLRTKHRVGPPTPCAGRDLVLVDTDSKSVWEAVRKATCLRLVAS